MVEDPVAQLEPVDFGRGADHVVLAGRLRTDGRDPDQSEKLVEEAARVMFNNAIETIRADGTYKKIQDKYFDFNVYGE